MTDTSAMPQELHELPGATFATALRSGIHRVILEQEFLNRINVFPVADGDTGTNLSLSLGAALETISARETEPLNSLLAATADVLLDSARGNSGAIVAQFFRRHLLARRIYRQRIRARCIGKPAGRHRAIGHRGIRIEPE